MPTTIRTRENKRRRSIAKQKGKSKFNGECLTHSKTEYYTASGNCVLCMTSRTKRYNAQVRSRRPPAKMGRPRKDAPGVRIRYAAVLRPSGETVIYRTREAAFARGRSEWMSHFGWDPHK